MKKLISILVILILIGCKVSANEIDVNALMNDYSKQIQTAIKTNLKYSGEENAVTTVSYQINSDGSIEDIKIEKSGSEGFDKAVIDAVQKSAPFKPFPEGTNFSNIRITSQFQHVVYKYQSPVESYKSTRMAILPVEPSAEVKKAHKDYMEKLQKYMFDRIPTVYSYTPNEPVIKGKVLKNGMLKDIEIKESSGIKEYDNKVVETFSKIKFQPFPTELNMYEELPFSMRVYRQYRTPVYSNPNFMFR